jgi:ketosteroid isomerase-like protein
MWTLRSLCTSRRQRLRLDPARRRVACRRSGALSSSSRLEPQLRGEITKVLTAGGVALVQNRWLLEGTQPDGSRIEMRGHSADVLRHATDGNWRILIDNPWGGG